MGADPEFFPRRAEAEIGREQASDDGLVPHDYLPAGPCLDLTYGREGDPRHGPGETAAPGAG